MAQRGQVQMVQAAAKNKIKKVEYAFVIVVLIAWNLTFVAMLCTLNHEIQKTVDKNNTLFAQSAGNFSEILAGAPT